MTAGQDQHAPAVPESPAAVPAAAAAPPGLTSAEAAQRLQRYGANTIAEARPRTALMLARGFWGLVPWMLEAAIAITLYLGSWVQAIVIGALLVFNAVLGFFQQTRAQRALGLLHQRLTVSSRVRRDGRWQELPAAQLVPGDVVHLRIGDIVPADIELSDGQLKVDQSQIWRPFAFLAVTLMAGRKLTKNPCRPLARRARKV